LQTLQYSSKIKWLTADLSGDTDKKRSFNQQGLMSQSEQRHSDAECILHETDAQWKERSVYFKLIPLKSRQLV
jgi:hypothetical protein